MNVPSAGWVNAEPPVMQRHRMRGWETVLDPRGDYAFVTACLFVLLLNNRLGTAAPLLLIGLVGLQLLRLALRRDLRVFRATLVLAVPFLSLLSVIWSLDPQETLRYSILYIVTALAGMLAASVHSHTGLLKSLGVALIVYNGMALIGGDSVTWLKVGQYAFRGLASSKNAGAVAASYGLITCVAWMYLEYKRRRPLYVAGLAMASGGCALIIMDAHSTGALLGSGIACICLVTWCVMRNVIKRNAILAFVLLGVLGMMAFVGQYLLFDELFSYILRESGKGAGISGRDNLWRIADMVIARHPEFGVGYGAFWLPNNIDAVGAWVVSGMPIGAAFSFHNTPREVLVALGYVGLVVFSFVLMVSFAVLVFRSIRDPKITSLYMVSIMLFMLSRLYFEVIGLGHMTAEAMLWNIAIAYPFFIYRGQEDPLARRRRKWLRYGYAEPHVPQSPAHFHQPG